ASEIDGQLLLLHQIKQGAASSSFGLHVAKMAGIPAEVLAAAEQYLSDQLSQQPISGDQIGAQAHDNIDLTKSSAPYEAANSVDFDAHSKSVDHQNQSLSNVAAPDIEYKSTNNQWVKIECLLSKTDPDALTPRQAHGLLYQLKELISDPTDL
ncbi:MAG: DNA mismatch repair protein MutS, partial [Psychrobacter sp.]|nr:DNA mismatch repair protein MutS [Psychrobacter sp.]